MRMSVKNGFRNRRSGASTSQDFDTGFFDEFVPTTTDAALIEKDDPRRSLQSLQDLMESASAERNRTSDKQLATKGAQLGQKGKLSDTLLAPGKVTVILGDRKRADKLMESEAELDDGDLCAEDFISGAAARLQERAV